MIAMAASKPTQPNMFLTVADVHRIVNTLEGRRTALQNIRGTKRDQRHLTKLIDKLYAVTW
jgi:hypothetical protein